jgi:hypothetical protein
VVRTLAVATRMPPLGSVDTGFVVVAEPTSRDGSEAGAWRLEMALTVFSICAATKGEGVLLVGGPEMPRPPLKRT